MKCMMCPKTDADCRFYDPSPFRPICSKECYSKFFDEWTAKDSCAYDVMSDKRKIQIREAQRRWREKHKEEYREYHRNYRKKKVYATL